MGWRIREHESDSLTHYGVPGMKWGVRKEYQPIGRKKLGGVKSLTRTNSKQITANTTVKKLSNGKISVKGLEEIDEAIFDSQETYKKWLDGKTNPFAGTIDNQTVYSGGVKVSKGSPTVKGIGYELKFSNDSDYREYSKQLEKSQREYVMNIGDNRKNFEALKQRFPGMSESELFSEWMDIDSKGATQYWKDYSSQRVEGYIDYERNRMDSMSENELAMYGLTKESVQKEMEEYFEEIRQEAEKSAELMYDRNNRKKFEMPTGFNKDIFPVPSGSSTVAQVAGRKSIKDTIKQIGNSVSSAVSSFVKSGSNVISSIFKKFK